MQLAQLGVHFDDGCGYGHMNVVGQLEANLRLDRTTYGTSHASLTTVVLQFILTAVSTATARTAEEHVGEEARPLTASGERALGILAH